MKIIINESQLKMLIEDENKENLMPFPMDRIVGNSEKKTERFDNLISKFNPKRYDGIVILGDLEYVGSDLRTHGSLISKFSKEEILSKVKIDGEILI
jgi:hypothetical protein